LYACSRRLGELRSQDGDGIFYYILKFAYMGPKMGPKRKSEISARSMAELPHADWQGALRLGAVWFGLAWFGGDWFGEVRQGL